nr:hypothetical protein OG781_15130 [Streptomyces sp. NBC_00830]
MYWSVVFPGMTEGQAEWLLSTAEEGPHGLLGSIVDPNYFFSIHVDRYSAETMKEALLLLESSDSGIEAKGIARGLLEAVDDWLDAGGKYLEE